MKQKIIKKKRISSLLFLIIALTVTIATAANNVRRLRLNSEAVANIKVSTKGTILSFPTKPQKVILGKKASFGLEYVENDIAVSPLSINSKSNLTVYLEGRRYTFSLVASDSRGDDIVLIRDSLEKAIKVKIK